MILGWPTIRMSLKKEAARDTWNRIVKMVKKKDNNRVAYLKFEWCGDHEDEVNAMDW
jgi:hypothetical protein